MTNKVNDSMTIEYDNWENEKIGANEHYSVGRRIADYKRTYAPYKAKRLSSEEEAALFAKYKEGGEPARFALNALYDSCLYSISGMALHIWSQAGYPANCDPDSLVTESTSFVESHIGKFNPAKGTLFTYLKEGLQREMWAELNAECTGMSKEESEKLYRYNTAKDALLNMGLPADDKALRKVLNCSVNALDAYRNLNSIHNAASLDSGNEDDDRPCLYETIAAQEDVDNSEARKKCSDNIMNNVFSEDARNFVQICLDNDWDEAAKKTGMSRKTVETLFDRIIAEAKKNPLTLMYYNDMWNDAA